MSWMKFRTDRDGLATARTLAGILCLIVILCIQPRSIAGNEVSPSAQSPTPAPPDEQSLIPVATEAGVIRMTQQEYDEHIGSIGHLPVMSRSYIFGHTIPMPNTDELGHIHVSHPLPAAVPRGDIEQSPSLAPTVSLPRSKGAMQASPSSDAGTRPDNSRTFKRADHKKHLVRDGRETRKLGQEPAHQ